MKTIIASVILSLLVGFSAQAQQRQDRPPHTPPQVVDKAGKPGKYPSKEELQSQKIAFFTQELDLTPEEAQKFWPVYNAEEKKQHAAKKAINHSLKELNDALKADPKVSSAEIKLLMNKYFKACEEEISVQAESFEEISKVLPVEKAAKTFSLEERFRIMLIRHLRK